jgi:hypothetical protein
MHLQQYLESIIAAGWWLAVVQQQHPNWVSYDRKIKTVEL